MKIWHAFAGVFGGIAIYLLVFEENILAGSGFWLAAFSSIVAAISYRAYEHASQSFWHMSNLCGEVLRKREEEHAAVKKFLMAKGNDLCHENRAELAAAFGLGRYAKSSLVPELEFRENCKLYADDLYKETNNGPPA